MVINLKEYRDKKIEQAKEAAKKAALARILARVPVWPGDPK